MTPNGTQPATNGNGHAAPQGGTGAAKGMSPDHHRFVESMAANALMMRQQWFQQALDGRRSIEDDCGYPSSVIGLGADFFRNLYESEPIAARVVELMPKETWQVTPLVYEDEDSSKATEFEVAWDELGQSLRGEASWYADEEGSPVWEHLKRADILSGIGHFGVILLGIDDGRNLQDPIEGFVVNKGRKAVPVYRDVPAVVHNEAGGATVDRRRQRVGYRMVFNGKDRPVMPDSPMTASEEAAIRDPKKRRVLQDPKGYHNVLESGPALNHGEEMAINAWVAERGIHAAEHEGMATNASSSATRSTDDGDRKRGKWSKPGRHDPSTHAVDSRGRPLSQVTGTDREYDGGHGSNAGSSDTSEGDMHDPHFFSGKNGGGGNGGSGKGGGFGQPAPSADLSGTDQQYFGVQFGPGEQQNSEPSKQKHKLLFVRAFDESLVQIVRYEWNSRNPRFGMPVMYRVTLSDPREQHSGVGLPLATVFVHWSRIIHVADNLRSSEIFGVPRQRHVLHRLLDLRKVYGAGAEAFYKNSQMKILLSTHPSLGPDVDVDVGKMRDDMENFGNGMQQWLFLQGMAGQTVAPSVVDPTPHVNVQLQAICIYLGCPMRVFMGSERGELASSQDDAAWNDRLRERQTGYLTPRVIVPFVDRLIALGVLPEPEGYSVEWPDLDSLGDADKATIALTLVQAIAAYVQGCEAIMPPLEFFTHVLGWDEEKAQAMLDAAAKAHEEQDTMTMPPQVAGQDAAPAKGTAADQQQKQAEAKAKAQADALAKSKPGMPGGPPVAPIKVKPGETLVHPASVPTPKPVPVPIAKIPTANAATLEAEFTRYLEGLVP